MLDRTFQPPHRVAKNDPRRCALLASGINTAPLLEALRRVPNTRVGDICIFPANGLGEPEADYLILATEDGSRLDSLEREVDRWTGDKTRILLAVPEAKCAFLGDLARRADGLIFLDAGLAYLEESLSLAREGYSVVPATPENDSGSACHLDLLRRLGESERQLLQLLAVGESNRSIAEQMGESETRVKSLVRAILVKLECRNRTEAAVLAATVLLPLLQRSEKDGAAGGGSPTP